MWLFQVICITSLEGFHIRITKIASCDVFVSFIYVMVPISLVGRARVLRWGECGILAPTKKGR